jgi:hypothetical protein
MNEIDFDFLKVAEQSFDFWNNSEDNLYNELNLIILDKTDKIIRAK